MPQMKNGNISKKLVFNLSLLEMRFSPTQQVPWYHVMNDKYLILWKGLFPFLRQNEGEDGKYLLNEWMNSGI